MPGVLSRLGLHKPATPKSGPPPPLPPHGGVRQRLGQPSSSHEVAATSLRTGGVKRRLAEVPTRTSDDSQLPFNKALRRDWSSGKISSKTVLEYATKAAQQGAESASTLGGDIRNAHRHLVKAIGYPKSAPDIEWIELPTKDGRCIPHPIVCPLKWFEKMVAHDPSKFRDSVLGHDGDVAEFWTHMRDHVIATSNRDRINEKKSIPCSIHGDGAPTNKVEGLFAISWSSMLGRGVTKDTRHVFSVVPKSLIGQETMDVLFKRFAWSFNALAAGRMPRKDWKGNRLEDGGRALAGGWRLAMIGLRGDWEFFCQVCGFPSSTSKPRMCWMCNASPDGPLCWARNDPAAPWRGTLHSHESYLAWLAAQGLPVPCIFLIRTLRLEGVLADVMHTMCLGVTAHVCGNIMHEVMEANPGWGATQADRVRSLDARLGRWYKETKEEHKVNGKLTYARIKKPGDWPKFLGKAASTRRLVVFCARLATEFNSKSEHDVQRVAVAQALVEMYDIMGGEPRFLRPESKARLARLSAAFMGVYAKLSASSLASGVRGWKMSPKFHLMQHIFEDQTFMNPRYNWVYADEDLQRILKDVALSCHAGNIAHMVLFKWAVHTFDDCGSSL